MIMAFLRSQNVLASKPQSWYWARRVLTPSRRDVLALKSLNRSKAAGESMLHARAARTLPVPTQPKSERKAEIRSGRPDSLFEMSIAGEVAKKRRTTKFVRWVNPFFKALSETPAPVATTRRVPDGTR